MDAITGEVELSKSGFSKGTVKYNAKDSTTQATVSSLSNPLDGLKLSNSTLIGQVGVKSEITKQLKGTLSACYVSGPGAMGVETAISKAGGIGATSFAAQCKVGDVMYSAKTTMKLDAYQVAAVNGVGAGETVGVAVDGKAGGDVKASLAYAKKLGGGHSVKCVVVNPVKKSFDPVVSANFVTSVLPKTTTTVAVQVDKAVRSFLFSRLSFSLVFCRFESLYFSLIKRERFQERFQGYASQTIAGGNALLGWLPRVSPIVFSSVARRFVCAGLIPPMLERHNKRRTLKTATLLSSSSSYLSLFFIFRRIRDENAAKIVVLSSNDIPSDQNNLLSSSVLRSFSQRQQQQLKYKYGVQLATKA